MRRSPAAVPLVLEDVQVEGTLLCRRPEAGERQSTSPVLQHLAQGGVDRLEGR